MCFSVDGIVFVGNEYGCNHIYFHFLLKCAAAVDINRTWIIKVLRTAKNVSD